MSHLTEHSIDAFLNSNHHRVITQYQILDAKYLHALIRKSFFAYDNFAYRNCRKIAIDSLNDIANIEFFDGDPPEDVLDYISKVDEYFNYKDTLQSLVRKIVNTYDMDAAYIIARKFYILPKGDLSLELPRVKEMILELRRDAADQLAVIQKIKIDNLLLK